MSISSDASAPTAFLEGANLPWIHYGIDFGANAWRPDGGVALEEERAQLEAAFGQLAASGIQHVRWFLLCDGRAGIQFSERGQPLGPDQYLFRDMDAALETAQRHRMRVMFVLLDFLWCDTARSVRGVQMGGRAHILQDPDNRHALLDTVLRPLLERYGKDPSIFAWDIINEPEWITTLTTADVRAFLAESVSLAHASAQQPVTVGSAGTRWRDRYEGLGLDFYQVHWYDSLRHQPPLHTPVTRLGFDRPVLLGEFPTRGSRKSVAEIVDTAKAAGYSGALYWSALSQDECSRHS
ncbi:MAG TPA: hypothetical protein VJM31_09320 [Vicinamibacterales bacterium]|nr:hypothetical protein [Vicinamibacterales bacterium]